MKNIFVILGTIIALSSIVSAKEITLTQDEANLAIQCINSAQVINVAAAVEPLLLRDKMLDQAQSQMKGNDKVATIKFDLEQKEAEILIACIQNARVENVAGAEAPINLAQKVIAQYNEENTKESKKNKK